MPIIRERDMIKIDTLLGNNAIKTDTYQKYSEKDTEDSEFYIKTNFRLHLTDFQFSDTITDFSFSTGTTCTIIT